MTQQHFILAIDQGTTSSRAILFSQQGEPLLSAQQEFPQHYPEAGWVEHNPEDIWRTVVEVCQQVAQEAKQKGLQISGIGITNQRETTLVWDKATGQPIYNAIVWQDRRTAGRCEYLNSQGKGDEVQDKTGLLLDPYFSATKVAWILDHVEGARDLAAQGRLAFGTVDSFLIWRLTGGKVHATDITNASRTSLFNIHSRSWDDSLLSLFNVPASVLPEVKQCADDFGVTDNSIFGDVIPILGVAGDQQAAAIGESCFTPGDIKSTYGTGCFVLVNTGEKALKSDNQLLTTIAYQVQGQTHYALEGSIFIAGAGVQWLRDGIEIIEHAKDTQPLAESLDYDHDVYLVPAFAGLGAPHWDPHARGAVFGITRGTTQAHLARATLESVCYQTHDLLAAMQDDGVHLGTLRVDGGMVGNDWLCQFLADILSLPVERPRVMETTALGVAYLAALQLGWGETLQSVGQRWQRDKAFTPHMDSEQRDKLLAGWERAVKSTLMFSQAQ